MFLVRCVMFCDVDVYFDVVSCCDVAFFWAMV